MKNIDRAREIAATLITKKRAPIVYIYKDENGEIEIAFVELKTALMDGPIYTLLEIVYASELLKE